MKRKISIYLGRFQKYYGPFRALELAKEIGADAVDFSLDGLYNVIEPESVYAKGDAAVIEHFTQLKAHADAIGIEIAQTHGQGKGYTLDQEENARIREGGRLDCIATRCLGAKHCVMHNPSTYYLPDAAPETMRALHFQMYTELLPYAKENGIKIAMETGGNIGRNYDRCGFFANIEEFIAAYEAVASIGDNRNWFCYCMDTGHTNMATRHYGNPAVPDYTRRLGSAVEVLHINDNEGLTDWHAIPNLDAHPLSGCVDWWDFMRALDDIGYQGYYNLEMGFNNYGLNMATEEAIFAIKVMKNILFIHYGEEQEGFINEKQFLKKRPQ